MTERRDLSTFFITGEPAAGKTTGIGFLAEKFEREGNVVELYLDRTYIIRSLFEENSRRRGSPGIILHSFEHRPTIGSFQHHVVFAPYGELDLSDGTYISSPLDNSSFTLKTPATFAHGREKMLNEVADRNTLVGVKNFLQLVEFGTANNVILPNGYLPHDSVYLVEQLEARGLLPHVGIIQINVPAEERARRNSARIDQDKPEVWEKIYKDNGGGMPQSLVEEKEILFETVDGTLALEEFRRKLEQASDKLRAQYRRLRGQI